MGRARGRRKMAAEGVELAVSRIMSCQARRLAAAMREDRAASEAEIANIERIRSDLPTQARDTVDRVVLVRSRLQGAGDAIQRRAIARRHIINQVDDFVDAISVLSPKVVKDGEWHHVDERDEQLIGALFEFIRRFDLLLLLNERRDRYFAAHHAHLATFPKDQFYKYLDEFAAEHEAARRKTLEAADLDWIEEALLREEVSVDGSPLPVRVKDVAKAMNVSESARRVRKHRRTRTRTKVREK